MAGQIAVFLGEKGDTASLKEKGTIRIYQRELGKWRMLREREFTLDQATGLVDLRKKMEEIVAFLQECRIFVGLSVTGVPYFMLEKAHCSIWECKGKPHEFLDYILEKEEKERRVKSLPGKEKEKYGVVEVSPGKYRVSLQDIQGTDLGITSKQVLRPFIKKGEFEELEITCNHLPPWLEGELLAGNYLTENSQADRNLVRVRITKA